ncbi:oligosaccharide flippase family protein [Patescibacteria group bacterium]|nr:oligosaccharide flippase family protein [Patescibacteria group bacterium]MBU1931226.1 oligosaccharide flippase family protein [Patescibacteria group bacterium]
MTKKEQAADRQFLKIKTRSIKGVVALGSRTAALQLVTFLATFALTILLNPEEYGVFFLISALINFFTYFSDIGLAAALIQKKKKLSQDDLNTTFLIQQFLVVSLVILAWIVSSRVSRWYGLSVSGLWLYRALAFSLLLSSLKTIPSIILERQLLFSRLVLPQVFETLAFYSVAVFLAWRGFGVNSFSYAVLARGVLGLVTIYWLVPWRPSLRLNWRVAKRLFSFGVPFQLNSLLALIKDDLLIAFLGKILPLQAVGYIGWAQKWALFPFRIVADNLIRITFPVYARLQKFPGKLKAAVEKSIYAVAVLVFPALTGLALIADKFVVLFPNYEKWQPAVLALRFFCINGLFASISTSLTNMLAAIGKIKINLKLMVFWTTLTWILTPVLVFKIGYNGAALASALVASTSFITVYLAKKELPFRFFSRVWPPALSSLIMALGFYALAPLLTGSLLRLGLLIFISAIIYLIAMLAFNRQQLYHEIKSIRGGFSKND